MTEENFCVPKSSYNPDEIDSYLGFCFPTAAKCWIDGLDYCDEEPTNQDCGCFGPRGRDCIVCYTCLSPIGLVIDSITLIFRLGYCSYLTTKKCCQKCCQKPVESN